MNAFETIRLEADARGVARLTLARPEKHNALNEQMMRELTAAAAAIDQDSRIRVVILKSDGPTFCAGGDLNWMKEQAARDTAGREEGAKVLSTMLQALDQLRKPLIARVSGNAFGGGIGMMAVADIVVAAEGAEFALTETRLGLIPATIGPYVVARIGEGAARRTFLNGYRFGTQEAQRMGLVSRSAPLADLDLAMSEEVELTLACAPGAIAEAKALIQTLSRGTVADSSAFSAEALAQRWGSEEAISGIAAFFSRRPMPWLPPGDEG